MIVIKGNYDEKKRVGNMERGKGGVGGKGERLRGEWEGDFESEERL